MNQSMPAVLSWVLDALQSFDGVLASGGVAAALFGLADDALLDATVQVESLGRVVDGLRVAVAGEVAARSAAEFGNEGLARSHNFRNASLFLSSVTGASKETMRDRVKLAGEVHTSMSLVGLPNPPRFPRVAEALARGELGIDAAAVITRRLTEAASRVGFTEEVSEAEGNLVFHTQQSVGGFCYTANEIDALAVRYREHLDPDGAEPRDRDLHDSRTLTLTELRSGMTRLTALLPPSSAGIVKAALEPFTSPRVSFPLDPPDPSATCNAPAAHVPGATTGSTDPATTSAPDSATADSTDPAATDPGDPSDPAYSEPTNSDTATAATLDPAPATALVDDLTRDTRTPGQKRADALERIFALAAGHPAMPRLNGAAPTVNLHATLDDVVTGRGIGWIDGLDTPVPHTTVEALLCHGDVITTLFGEHGQVLQHGKTKRLFTTAQNRALAARDGGCVWPGCDAPPSWCESHHVDGWLSETHPGGRTDIDNGALLCHFHHSHVHKARWKLTIRHGTPHLIPPKWLDWSQTPRPCQQNRARQKPDTHPPAIRTSARKPTAPPPTRPPATPPEGTGDTVAG